jgi:hypothetical protein
LIRLDGGASTTTLMPQMVHEWARQAETRG